MAESVLSSVLSGLLKILMSPEVLKFATPGVGSKLKQLEQTLRMIDAVLIDAEEKQLTNEAVKIWFEELQDLAYDAEDILDEYATEALTRRLKIEEHQDSTNWALKLILACCSNYSPCALWYDHFSMRYKIYDITNRLQDLCDQKDKLKLTEIPGRRLTGSSERPPTASLLIEPVLYGRDEDKAKILEMVLSDGPGDANYGVVSIVGMGGLGKTALAQHVYNDEAVKDFYPKGWVCVSDDFDVTKISIDILESITKSGTDLTNLDPVQKKIKEQLDGRKFLLVLDDVWSDNYNDWLNLRSLFLDGARGSKIIVTTRHVGVALKIEHCSGCHQLLGLLDNDCWSLFKGHAIVNDVMSSLPIKGHAIVNDVMSSLRIDVIRQKVVEKCKGLPLAARVLGGLLRSMKREKWLELLNSKTWESLGKSEIPEVLRISYYHLPLHLKRCFAYCGIFPKDYQFKEKELVLLWIAEGFIQQSNDDKPLEELGGEYFYDLLSRSIFQKSSSDTSRFIMHDLVNDLAVKVSGKLSFRLNDELQSKISKNTRYCSYLCHIYNDKSRFEVLNDAKHLRTHLTLPPLHGITYISSIAISYLFLRFKMLRVLSLQGYSIVEVPDSIGDLRLLRHLNLSYSRIRSLPNSINSLCNLQSLLLRNCSNFFEWPSNMGNLVNLHYLDIFNASLVKEMPIGIRKWVSLQSLSNFIVGKDSGSNLEYLEELESLYGELHISELKNVTNFQLGGNMILINKKGLKMLTLDWGLRLDWGLDWGLRFDESNDEEEESWSNESNGEEEESRDEEMDKRLLDMLRPHQNLENLTIKSYGGKTFSSWVGDGSLSKMTVLKLEYCKKCASLPSLGLLGSLKDLTIKGIEDLKSINSTFYGHCQNPFKYLETLYFENLENCESWDPIKENESFPNLRELSIVNCPKLSERLPNNLSSLKKLVIRECEQLVVSLSNMPKLCKLEIDKCKEITCEIDKCKKITCTSSAFLESLEYMSLSNISDFGDLSRQEFKKVQNLKIGGCNELVELWQNKILLEMSSLNSLKNLEFSKCNTLTNLLEGIKQKNVQVEELRIESCDSLNFIFRGQLPPSLKKLRVKKCEKLQCLLGDNEDSSSSLSSATFSIASKEVNATTSHLEDLYIEGCLSLTCLPSINQLSLTSLHISDCPKLTTLSLTGHLPVALKHLTISKCSELTTLLPKGHFPETLETLMILSCEKLESIVEKFHNNKALWTIQIRECQNLKSLPEGLETLSNLKYLMMLWCGGLASFPKGGFPDSNLGVGIFRCKMLEALPSGIHTLSYLQIIYCPNLSLSKDLPTKLTRLAIESLKQYKVFIERGLHNFTSLIDLRIHGGGQDGESIQETDLEITLPPNLTTLWIGHFPKLKCLPFKDFQGLTSLERLHIGYCPELTSLPSILPSSVMELLIKECPSLNEACKRDKGKEWPKIADIPCVLIDQRFSSLPDE